MRRFFFINILLRLLVAAAAAAPPLNYDPRGWRQKYLFFFLFLYLLLLLLVRRACLSGCCCYCRVHSGLLFDQPTDRHSLHDALESCEWEWAKYKKIWWRSPPSSGRRADYREIAPMILKRITRGSPLTPLPLLHLLIGYSLLSGGVTRPALHFSMEIYSWNNRITREWIR